ncbi:MAG: hypothetical protein ACIAXF_10980 [Phycisphaerales bacterium JB063]
MPGFRPTSRLILTAALVVPMTLVGCQSKKYVGRVPVEETTPGEARNPQQLPVTLSEFSALVPEDLLNQLPELPEISEIDGPVVILMGDVQNKTGVTPTADYEYVVSGIRSRLINSRIARSKLVFVERRARVEGQAARERVASAPVEQPDGSLVWNGGVYFVPDYDAANTFVMNMDAYRVGRGDTGLYAMEVQLVSFTTNRIVFSNRYEMKQISE